MCVCVCVSSIPIWFGCDYTFTHRQLALFPSSPHCQTTLFICHFSWPLCSTSLELLTNDGDYNQIYPQIAFVIHSFRKRIRIPQKKERKKYISNELRWLDSDRNVIIFKRLTTKMRCWTEKGPRQRERGRESERAVVMQISNKSETNLLNSQEQVCLVTSNDSMRSAAVLCILLFVNLNELWLQSCNLILNPEKW